MQRRNETKGSSGVVTGGGGKGEAVFSPNFGLSEKRILVRKFLSKYKILG